MLRVFHVTTILAAELTMLRNTQGREMCVNNLRAEIEITANRRAFSFSRYLLNRMPVKKNVWQKTDKTETSRIHRTRPVTVYS